MNRMDSILSRGMGKAKAMKARLTGLVGVFKTLAEQHGEVTALLDRAKTSDEKFAELWPEIRRELISHERAEVGVIYPMLRAYAQTAEMADHHDIEAGELEALIGRIDSLAIDAPERRQLFQQLIDTVTHHAREEEHDIFPKAQDAIGKDQVRALEDPFLRAKHQAAMLA